MQPLPDLSKRQHEVLERLELGHPVKKIATDIGVSRNAVYQTIERLRRAGAVPESYTPSGQPPRRLAAVGAASAPTPLAPRASVLRELRRVAGEEPAGYARTIETAIASGDVAALAYELGRHDAAGGDETVAAMAESALERLSVLADGGADVAPGSA